VGRRIALRGLRYLNDTRTRDRLVRLLGSYSLKDGTERALCLAALAARGDSASRIALHEAAHKNGEMLAAALEVMPKLTVDDWAARALAPGDEHGTTHVKLLLEALDAHRHGPFLLPDDTLAAILAAIEERADKISAPRLRLLVRELPGCRTAAVAHAYLQSLATGDDLRECDLAFLEVADEAALRARLLSFLKDKDHKDPALDGLMQLGSPAHGDALARRWPFQQDHDLFVLARSGSSKEVRAMLAKRVKGLPESKPPREFFQPLCALAMAHQIPERTARAWNVDLRQLPDAILRRGFERWRKAVLDGRPVDALLDYVKAIPLCELSLPGLGLVRDPGILAFLQQVRACPGSDVQWAIGELAVAGDATARAAMQLVRERAYYGWADDLPGFTLLEGPGRGPTRGRDLVPYWIGEVETNCCRRVAANKPLEQCGFDIFAYGDLALSTQHAAANRWWQRFGPRLRWSRVAQRFVVGP
jgi:hypothetical protein